MTTLASLLGSTRKSIMLLDKTIVVPSDTRLKTISATPIFAGPYFTFQHEIGGVFQGYKPPTGKRFIALALAGNQYDVGGAFLDISTVTSDVGPYSAASPTGGQLIVRIPGIGANTSSDKSLIFTVDAAEDVFIGGNYSQSGGNDEAYIDLIGVEVDAGR